MIAGCAQTGDFGRATPSLSAVSYAASGRGQFAETDAEREMHARVWRFMQMPRKSGWQSTMPWPMTGKDILAVRQSYYGWLNRTPYASSSVRYATLADDVQADLGTLPATFAAVCVVVDLGRQREIALAGLPGIEPEMAQAVVARRARNEDDIARFSLAVRLRFEAYSYALDHLLVAAPDPAAIRADGLLADLQVLVRRADERRFCERAAAS
jgi:hypothetical protein